MNIAIAILASIIFFFVMTVMFAKEMITTQLGTLCVVKCALAAVFYLIFAVLLTWVFFTQFYNPLP